MTQKARVQRNDSPVQEGFEELQSKLEVVQHTQKEDKRTLLLKERYLVCHGLLGEKALYIGDNSVLMAQHEFWIEA